MAQVNYGKLSSRNTNLCIWHHNESIISMFFITVLFLFCLFHDLLPCWVGNIKTYQSTVWQIQYASLTETRVFGVNAQNSRFPSAWLSFKTTASVDEKDFCSLQKVGSRGLELVLALSLLPPLLSTVVPPCPPGLWGQEGEIITFRMFPGV